tara:strand:- start:28 stop:288 length:261 start_codon:yes stop_codon:yes gene_type:complete
VLALVEADSISGDGVLKTSRIVGLLCKPVLNPTTIVMVVLRGSVAWGIQTGTGYTKTCELKHCAPFAATNLEDLRALVQTERKDRL